MGFTICPNWITEDASKTPPTKTIGELRQTGRFYRHPDSALISYPLVVDQPMGRIDKPVKIAVVGGGIAGIASIYELSRLPNACENISITLFESEPDHFTAPAGFGDDSHRQRAGRVFTGSSGGSNSKNAVYEIGAMRFPEIAGLTWHYASQVFGDGGQVKVFPNPGKVPTEFIQGERVDRYMAGGENGHWLDTNSPVPKLVKVIQKGLFGNPGTDEDVSLFRIGGKDPAKVSDILKSELFTAEDWQQLNTISEEWKEFAKKYDSLTLESAIRQIVREKLDELDCIPGLESDDAKVNYYVELFGRFGFGTGGFKSIFNTSLTEMTRLNLWQYANEYTLPTTKNVDLVSKLFDKALSNGFQDVTVRQARVCDVCHLDEGGDTQAAVLSYSVDGSGVEDTTPQLDTFDYVILAVTPKQANSIVSRLGFKNVEREVILGDYQRQYAHPLKARPALVLSNLPEADVVNSQVFAAINQIHMVSSSKIYASIKKTIYDSGAPSFNGDKIKAIVSDCGLASSYIVPCPLQPEDTPEDQKYYSCLLSYAWEEDTKNLQNELLVYPKNAGGETPENRSMIEKIINRTIRDVLDPEATGETPNYKKWWFGEVLGKAHNNDQLTDVLSYDWTTHHSSGAFKLDVTGDYYNSHLLFRYHTHALQARALNNRFFLANCSYSHVGGWIEGALMSAVNAVSGLILAANQGDLYQLSEEARPVITSFEPVA